LTGAGASSADTGEIKPADPTTFNERASYSPYASRIDAERPYVEDEHAHTASSVDVSGCGATRGLDESTHSARDEYMAGYAAAYNPRTGTYARGAVAYGPYGAAGAAQAYNPRTGAYGQTRQGANPYGSWGSTSVARGDQWASTQRTTNNATGVTKRTTQSSAGSSARVTGPGGSTAAVAKSNGGDLYAGHDGNVYKKDSSGGYQKYDNGSWSNVQQPTQAQKQQAQSQASSRAANAGANSTTMSQVQSDAAARTQGAQRTSTYSRGGGGSSYRPSGGGGGRRR
jgi:hypothetical protein